jgi:hypothetical protein
MSALTLHTASGNVQEENRNRVSQSRCQGYTVGANSSAIAIGHAQASGDSVVQCRRAQTATAKPQAAGSTTNAAVGKTSSSAV